MSDPRSQTSLRGPLLVLQHDILEMVATGQALRSAMDEMCRRVAAMVPGVIPSILTVDGANRLRPLSAPLLSQEYAKALEGTPIGPNVGSCGTAAHYGVPVEVLDIRTDPRWADFQKLPLPPDVGSCWSSPIKARDGRVIGTFAFYYRGHRGASPTDRQIVAACVHLCAIAIENETSRSEMRRLAYNDTVTGLLNRAAFQRAITEAVAKAAETGEQMAIHYIDLDEFKGINDSLGHYVGDRVLACVAERLRAALPDEPMLARIGGDEFAVLQLAANREKAADLAWKALAIFSDPFVIGDHRIAMDASIGIAIAPDDGITLTDLMKNADLALYCAKADGRGRYRFHTRALAEHARDRRVMAIDLKRAISAKEFSVVYQPIVSVADRTVVACEALLRWNHPVRGPVPPLEFIPLAEEMGLILPIGEWVLREACAQAARWPNGIGISINLSPLQLRNARLLDEVRTAMIDFGVDAGRIAFEITETSILADTVGIRTTLGALKSLGIRIALDDFGTGYSSLWSLRTFPIDRIKIDQSFVRDFGRDNQSTSIVRAVIALAADLGMATTAEGIETAEQAEQLLACGCREGQGYYFSRPKSADDILKFLQSGDTPSSARIIGRAASA